MVGHVVSLRRGITHGRDRESLASLVGSLETESDANPNKALSHFLSRRVCRRGIVWTFLGEDQLKKWRGVLD